MKYSLSLLFFLFGLTAIAQTDTISPKFAPIYFEHNIDTVNNKWHERLDSLGEFLSDHPEFQVQIQTTGA